MKNYFMKKAKPNAFRINILTTYCNDIHFYLSNDLSFIDFDILETRYIKNKNSHSILYLFILLRSSAIFRDEHHISDVTTIIAQISEIESYNLRNQVGGKIAAYNNAEC